MYSEAQDLLEVESPAILGPAGSNMFLGFFSLHLPPKTLLRVVGFYLREAHGFDSGATTLVID